MIKVVQMDNLRDLLGIRRMDKFPNVRIRELRGVTNGVDTRIDEGVFWLFGHVERIENDGIAKRVYVEECAASCSRKRWIDTVKDYLKKRGLDVKQAMSR